MAPAFRFCLSNSTLAHARPIRYSFFYLSHIIVTPTGHNGQTERIFLLENKGAAENAVSALQRHNIYGNFDPSITLAWELLHEQCIQPILLSIGLLACATALIREKRSAEITKYRSEIAMLLLSGITAATAGDIYPLRIVLTGASCILASTLVSILNSSNTFPLLLR